MKVKILFVSTLSPAVTLATDQFCDVYKVNAITLQKMRNQLTLMNSHSGNLR